MPWIPENFAFVYDDWRRLHNPDADRAIEVGLAMDRISQDPEGLAERRERYEDTTLCIARVIEDPEIWLLYTLFREGGEDIVAALQLIQVDQ